MNLEQITHQAAKVAIEAGSFIRAERQSFSYEKVTFKENRSDLVSYVDKEAEQRILDGIGSLIPHAGYITEEQMTDQREKEYTWIIDPLDGTTNFVHRIPNYCVSVGLMHQGEIVAGVVYEIAKTPRFEDVVLATGFPYYNFEKSHQYLKILNQLMRNTQGLRRVGSAAADMAYVACGRYGGFFEYNLNAYDIAAGVVLVKEAGGTVTDFKGGADYLFGRELVAGGGIHPGLLKTIMKFW